MDIKECLIFYDQNGMLDFTANTSVGNSYPIYIHPAIADGTILFKNDKLYMSNNTFIVFKKAYSLETAIVYRPSKFFRWLQSWFN